MANPTTNYGFVLPTPTDLVTDLPADFDVALQGVDTRLKALQPGTTAGDLVYASSTANTNLRLGIGTAGQVLTVASGVPSWAAVSAGGMTLLNSGGTALTTTTTTINITTTGYTALTIYLKDVYGDNAQGVSMRINGDTGSNYSYSGVRNDGGVSAVNAFAASNFPYIVYQYPSNNTPMRKGNSIINIFEPTATDNFYVNWQSYGFSNTSTSGNVVVGGVYDGSAAITSLTFLTSSGNFAGGTAYIYGVK